MHLYQALAARVDLWRRANYPHDWFPPIIADWRSMVDSVMIDLAYDGQTFNIALADVPEKKDDLVSGGYRMPAPEGETAVAVKITDMLGEEVLVVKNV